MSSTNFLDRFIYNIIKYFGTVEENSSKDLGNPEKILIIRQHNQLGDLLASVSLFRAIKEKYPKCNITLIVSPANCIAVAKNKFIDRTFIFDKKKVFTLSYFKNLRKLLNEGYDLVIVPSTVSISFTSNLMGRAAKAKTRIGISELNGMKNKYDFFFDRRVCLDWRKYPDANVSDFCLDIVRPFGINTNDFSSVISFDNEDIVTAKNFLHSIKKDKNELLIGLHVGAGKPPNRWSLKKYTELITKLNKRYNARFYLTGTNADMDEITYVKNNLGIESGLFINKKIPELAAVISMSDLFITNDTGVMHVAGATKTPQVSIFGPTNPFNWAPVGPDKYFIRKSDLIDDVSVEDVYSLCERLLNKKLEECS